MSEALRMCSQATLWDIPSATSSPVEDFGVSPCDRQDGQTTDPCGREAAPAPASARRAKGEGLMMLVTSGRNGFGSSASAGLQRCLESRLMQRLDTAGSTLWDWTWRAKATPLRRRYFQRQALERRTSATGFSSVPTPQARLNGGGDYTNPEKALLRLEAGHQINLSDLATLAAVPTPMAGSPATETYNAAGNTDYSRRIVELASVTTPRSEDSQCAGAHRGSPDTLHSQANLASISTPSARDWKDTSGMSDHGVDPDGSTHSRLDQLPQQAQLAASGPTATGGTGATASTGQLGKGSTPSSGQLNAGYSRWLQGVPVMWDYFTIWATRNLKQRKRGLPG